MAQTTYRLVPQDSNVSTELLNFLPFSITIYDWSFWTWTGCISDFFFSLRITCLGITSNKKFAPFHADAATLSIWNTTDNSYDRNMGTVSAVVATVNMPWRKMYINKRFWSPSKPLKRHHKLFAFLAFLESSLWNNGVNNMRNIRERSRLPI